MSASVSENAAPQHMVLKSQSKVVMPAARARACRAESTPRVWIATSYVLSLLEQERAVQELEQQVTTCEQRLTELDSGPSALRPIWYGGAFAMGAVSSALGDKWSLGFIEETEKQVSEHLTSHLGRLPENDLRSRAIVTQMRDEEEEHGANAKEAGAAPLPEPIRGLMRVVAKIMTRTAYRV